MTAMMSTVVMVKKAWTDKVFHFPCERKKNQAATMKEAKLYIESN